MHDPCPIYSCLDNCRGECMAGGCRRRDIILGVRVRDAERDAECDETEGGEE